MSTPEVILIGLIVLGVVTIGVCAMFFERSVKFRRDKDSISAELPPKTKSSR